MMRPGDLKRGDIVWVDLDPVIGSEMAKTRPCLVIQCDPLNERSTVTTVVVMTTKPPKRPNPFMIEVSSGDTGLRENSWVLCHHFRSVDLLRVRGKEGRLRAQQLEEVGKLVRRALALTEG